MQEIRRPTRKQFLCGQHNHKLTKTRFFQIPTEVIIQLKKQLDKIKMPSKLLVIKVIKI
jgi:hypothetical protein